MSTATETGTQNGAMVAAPRHNRMIVQDDSNLSFLLDTARFEHMQRIALAMARSSLTPAHLRGSSIDEGVANCTRVCNQAFRWGFDPFAIMDSTYVVGGKLGYEGKLVAGVVNTRAGLIGRLTYTFTGAGDQRTVTVSGQFPGEREPRTVTVTLANAKTSNKIWITDPDQKLCYNGAIKWARRHCPEVILGVVTDDDLERITESRTVEATTATALPEIVTNGPVTAESLTTGKATRGTRRPAAEPEPQPEPQRVEEPPAPATEPASATDGYTPPDFDGLVKAAKRLSSAPAIEQFVESVACHVEAGGLTVEQANKLAGLVEIQKAIVAGEKGGKK